MKKLIVYCLLVSSNNLNAQSVYVSCENAVVKDLIKRSFDAMIETSYDSLKSNYVVKFNLNTSILDKSEGYVTLANNNSGKQLYETEHVYGEARGYDYEMKIAKELIENKDFYVILDFLKEKAQKKFEHRQRLDDYVDSVEQSKYMLWRKKKGTKN